MAVYYCHMCGSFVDDDYDIGQEVNDSSDLVCPTCFESNYTEDGKRLEE